MVWHPYHVFIMTICTAMVGEKWTSWYVALIFATTRTAMDLVAGVKKAVKGTQNENITHTGAYTGNSIEGSLYRQVN